MLIDIIAICSVLGAVATVIFTPCPWYWVFLLAVGYFVGQIFAHLFVALIISSFIDTIPIDSAIKAVRAGENPELTTAQKHERECFVVAKEGADKVKIEREH